MRATGMIFGLALMAGLSTTQVVAQEITSADRAAIAARVDQFNEAMRNGRIGDTVDFIPPRLLSAIATQSRVSEADLKLAMAAQAVEALKVVKFLSFGMDLPAAKAGVTPDRSRGYMLIPTDTLMEMPDHQHIQSKSTTLAFQDSGQWYLMRVDNAAHLAKLRESYPEFAGVEVPNGSMTAVK